MKTKYKIGILFLLVTLISSCDKDFETINVNPVLPSNFDPTYQFSRSQIAAYETQRYEGGLCQQIMCPFGGNTEGGNRNTAVDANSRVCWNALYGNPVKNLTDVIYQLKDNTDRPNLYNMARILRAYYFQVLVDYYGDVPYTEAGLAYISGIYLPKYDDNEAIYQNLQNELIEATDALDPNKDIVTGDIYFHGDISKWKKFGNSVLLRLGMRYTRCDEVKAKAIVIAATDPARGGVMTSNDDNVVVRHNSIYTNATNSELMSGTRHNWLASEPFVDFLKNRNDPRLPYTLAIYEFPEQIEFGTANTNPEDQIGAPFGYNEINIEEAPNFPGRNGGGFKYSQLNRETCIRVDGWMYLVTYAQTQLLLAEARQRGYISTLTTKEYYEAGIRGHMSQLDTWAKAAGETSPITASQQDTYLLGTEVAFDPSRALEQINEQYWVSCLMIWPEAWANFRRSGYPQLAPISYPGEDPSVAITSGGDGFVHRLEYPLKQISVNPSNVNEAITRMGGNNMGVRLFWDPK